MTSYRQAVAEPASGKASGRLGMVLHAHAHYQPAEQAYDRAIRLEPREFAWRYYLALVKEQLSEPEQALNTISAALGIRSDYVPAILKQGQLLFQMGRFAESEKVYQSVLAREPASPAALYGLAKVKTALNDVPAAEDLYRRATQAYSTFGPAYYGLAVSNRSLGHEADAAKNFELAQRYAHDSPPAMDPLFTEIGDLATGIYYHLEQGDQFARNGQTDQAVVVNDALLERDPENFRILLNLLYLARASDHFPAVEVESLYARAKRINPESPLIYVYYGGAMARQGKYDVASVALHKALDLSPDNAEANSWLAEVLERQNRPAEAIQHYERALAARPSDRALQMEFWRALIVSGRAREAIPQLLPATQIDDTYTSYLLILAGEAYRATGDTREARRYLEHALARVRAQGPPELQSQVERELNRLPPVPR